VRTPQAFLFDEPLSNLDARLRIEMRAELKKLHRQLRTTTIYVTHDQEEAMTLGDRVVVMKDGLVHQYAAPLEVYGRPVNRFVAGFVGMPPMNFFEGRLVGRDGALYFDEGSGQLRLSERMARRVAERVGEEMVLGIRPESLAPSQAGRFPGTDSVLDVSVTLIEPLGDKMDVYVETPRHKQVVCRVDADQTLTEGMRLPMHVNMEQVHVSSQETKV
jgi:multiple sugar transport system ATP-binding protein